MNEREVEGYLDFAVEVMGEAGAIAMRYFRSDLEVTNKQSKRSYDPVTRADLEVEAHVRARISAAYPEHAIVGEEEGMKSGSGDMSWLIDPIDGTRGFITGSPMWGMLLGLMSGPDCIAGVMHQPYLGETYCGSAAGAFRITGARRQPLQTRSTAALADAVLCCTHPDMFLTPAQQETFARLVARCRFSRFGTECLGYGMLAAGFADIVMEADLEPYDIVPLIPIVEAAGGVVTNWDGGPAVNGGAVIAAGNPELHRHALDHIAGR